MNATCVARDDGKGRLSGRGRAALAVLRLVNVSTPRRPGSGALFVRRVLRAAFMFGNVVGRVLSAAF